MNTTTYLASKPRYEILDGLRGVAAMIVVAIVNVIEKICVKWRKEL